MQNAADVRSAYLALEDDLSLDLMDTPAGQDRELVAKLRAAQLQTEAAHKTMWIIHEEEQKG